jgi:replicative DNA helicase
MSLELHNPPEPDDVTRPLPHAVGPEKSVLSTLLKDPAEYFPAAIEAGLTEEHFYLPQHAILFGLMLDLFHGGEEIELVSLVQKLLDKGMLDRAGGPAAVTDIFTYAPSSASFALHLGMIRQKRILRAVIQASNEAIAEAYDGPERAEDLVDALEAKLSGVREDSETRSTMRRAGDEIAFIISELSAIVNDEPRATRGLPTGYEEIDRISGGLKPGEMFVIAARPSVGKTSLMMNIVENVAIDLETPTLVFSLEMPRLSVVSRLTYSRAKLAMALLNSGHKPTKGDLLRFQQSALAVKTAPLWIDDRAGLTIQEMRAKARRLHRKQALGFIAIDYLQLIKSRSKQASNSREREVGEVSAGIKELAKELNIPILVLAQLNRDAEKRTGSARGIPRMSDLRESGTIEQDADLVGLLHRADYSTDTAEQAEEKRGQAELNIAKNRNGATGRCPLTFIADLMRFETGAPVQEPLLRQQPKSRYED